MKILIEVDDKIWEERSKELVAESEGKLTEFESLGESLRELLNHHHGINVENVSKKVIVQLEDLIKDAKFHADAEERGKELLEKSKANGDAKEILTMYEETIIKQKGFKEAYEEIIFKHTGKFASVEQLVKEHGDLSGEDSEAEEEAMRTGTVSRPGNPPKQ
jgi:hypothetical protein